MKYTGEYKKKIQMKCPYFELYAPVLIMELDFISHKGLILSHLLHLIRNKVTLRTFSITAM